MSAPPERKSPGANRGNDLCLAAWDRDQAYRKTVADAMLQAPDLISLHLGKAFCLAWSGGEVRP